MKQKSVYIYICILYPPKQESNRKNRQIEQKKQDLSFNAIPFASLLDRAVRELPK